MKPEQIAKRMARRRWSNIHGYTDSSDELMHYGVKGMKWGVRRTPEQLGHKQKSKKSTDSDYEAKTRDMLHRINEIGKFDISDTYGKYLDAYYDNGDYNELARMLEAVRTDAKNLCREIVQTCNKEDRHEFLSELSVSLDAGVYDGAGVMAVDKKTGRMQYNSCRKFYDVGISSDNETGNYNTRELDKAFNETPDSMYYYVWGELQNTD